jgi:hypothetical protein
MTFWKRAAVETGVWAMRVWAVATVTLTVAVFVWLVVLMTGCGQWSLPTEPGLTEVHPTLTVDAPLATVKAE